MLEIQSMITGIFNSLAIKKEAAPISVAQLAGRCTAKRKVAGRFPVGARAWAVGSVPYGSA